MRNTSGANCIEEAEVQFVEVNVPVLAQVIYSGNRTVVILPDGSKGIAKCCFEDVFNKKIGHELALGRAIATRDGKRYHKA